jgi:hypothetical protein
LRLFKLSNLLSFVCFHLNTLDHALVGTTGLDFLPLPPPCGWSQGFLATPLTLGFHPSPLFFPALPIISLL